MAGATAQQAIVQNKTQQPPVTISNIRAPGNIAAGWIITREACFKKH
jgi:hypothetical protein